MRSAREIRFRLWQQVENLRLFVLPPQLSTDARVGELPLPDAAGVAAVLKHSVFAQEIVRLADEILVHRFPLFGRGVETGPDIEWRKDYLSGRVTGTDYFRFIPYLDFAKAGDHKEIWELNRHQHLIVLAQAWLFTSKRPYLAEVEAELDSWFKQNPFLRGINFSSALEVAFRALSWLWVDHMIGRELRPDISQKIRNGLFQHGHFLQANLSTYFSPNTHLLGEAVALHALGLKFPATKWERLGHRILAEERDRQIQNDGSHFEQSTYYHVYALDFFVFYYLLAGKPEVFKEPIRKMAKFLAAINGPLRLLSFIGDDDGGRFFHPYGDRTQFGRATLATCARLFPDEHLPLELKSLHEQSFWWLGPAAVESVSPSQDSILRFPDSGLASITRGNIHLLMDTGPFGPGGAGHSHSDTLAIVLRIGDREVLIDPGTFTYVADSAARDRFRGSGYHNTIRIDNLDQATPVLPFRWESKPEVDGFPIRQEGETVFVEGTCCSRGLTHRRRVALAGTQALFILDEIFGDSNEHLIEQCWHGEDLIIASTAPVPPERKKVWRSRCLGSKEPSQMTLYRWRAKLPLRVATAILLSDSANLQLEMEDLAKSVRLRIPGLSEVEFPNP